MNTPTPVPFTNSPTFEANTPWLVQRLSLFRQTLEQELDEPLEEFVAPAILVLDDLCSHFGLSESDKQVVLGAQGVSAVAQHAQASYTMTRPETPLADTSGPFE